MTTLFLFLLGGLVGTFVGEFIADKFIWKGYIPEPPEPKQEPLKQEPLKQEPIDPEDQSYWNYSKLRLMVNKND
jgi:hypothetical protein